MKLTRKLVPAFAMLLVAAVMMSTASFAWFSMNTQVKATGMSVTAKTPASLEISADQLHWSYSVTPTSASATELEPITYYDSATEGKDGWYVPAANNAIQADGNTTKELNDANIEANYWTKVDLNYTTGIGGSTKYALVSQLYFRTNAGTDVDDVDAIHFNAKIEDKNGGALADGVKVYIWDDDTDTLTPLSASAAGDWEAPKTGGSKELTVVVVYDGKEYSVVNNTKADTTPTNISLAFDKVAP